MLGSTMENLQATSQNGSSDNEPTFQFTSEYSSSVEELFAWHTRSGAFARLNPPWNPVKVLFSSGGIENGTRVRLQAGMPPITFTWELEHSGFSENVQFIDSQVKGPFSHWKHTHSFSSRSSTTSQIHDAIYVRFPIGNTFALPFLRKELARVFKYRADVLQKDLVSHAKWSSHPRLKVLIAGASGLVGTHLSAFLTTAGHTVFRLVRRTPHNNDEFEWHPEKGTIAEIPPVDAVINLCGEDISQGRWNAGKKARLITSRIIPTQLLASKIKEGKIVTKSFISASAIGFYGSRGSEILSEHSPRGEGFFPQLAAQWEEAATSVESVGVRSLQLRFGVILSARGGALKKMLLPFLSGVGGQLGTGEQWFSWIALQDVLSGIEHILYDERASGPINFTSPSYITNREYTKALGKVVRRPTICAIPAMCLRLIFGELADEALLSSCKATPQKLSDLGYCFQLPEIEGALRFELGR
jgi:uncharacterized protein (TIGR01777 family)